MAKYPASTVQILGAEKALFRALKTKGNTPKYGLIYHASAIARAAPKNKGRMSRFLANKISIAARIDCFSDHTVMANGQLNNKFGEVMAQQVEERLAFYETGKPPGKNSDAMKRALEAIEVQAGDLMDVDAEDDSDDEDAQDDTEGGAAVMPQAAGASDPADKKKKEKKEKKDSKKEKDGKKEKKDKDSKKKKSKDGEEKSSKEAKIQKEAEKAKKKAEKKAKKDKKA